MNGIFVALTFALIFGAAALWGAWRARTVASWPLLDRLLALVMPPLCVLTAFEFLGQFGDAVSQSGCLWTGNRLTPAFALTHGYELYYGPSTGPIIGMIYGPVMALAYLPATLASSPTGALVAGSSISMLLFFGPVAWMYLGGRVRDARSLAPSIVGLLCFCLLSLGMSSFWTGFWVHADPPALGLTAAACGLLCLYDPRKRLILPAAAVLAVLACWAKQPAAFLIPAMLLYVFLNHGLAALRRFAGWLALAGVVVSGGMVLAFGWEHLVFNMFTVPRGHFQQGPLDAPGPLSARAFALSAMTQYKRLVADLTLPLVMIAFTVLLSIVRPEGAREQRLAAIIRHRWIILFMAGVAGLPAAIIGGVKIGGAANVLAYATYFVSAAATLSLVELSTKPAHQGAGTAAGGAKMLLLAVGIALAVSNLPPSIHEVRKGLADLSGNCQQQAYDFARAHPGEVYYPWHPLPTLMAEGKLYHFSYGMFDRELAGFPVTEGHFREGIPEGVRYIGLPIHHPPIASRYPPEFSREIRVPQLPEWRVLIRPSDPEAERDAQAVAP